MNRKVSSALEGCLSASAILGVFSFVLGLESNIRPFSDTKVQDVSFRTYLEQGKRESGDNIGTYALALWTYPGARVGCAIHNYGSP